MITKSASLDNVRAGLFIKSPPVRHEAAIGLPSKRQNPPWATVTLRGRAQYTVRRHSPMRSKRRTPGARSAASGLGRRQSAMVLPSGRRLPRDLAEPAKWKPVLKRTAILACSDRIARLSII